MATIKDLEKQIVELKKQNADLLEQQAFTTIEGASTKQQLLMQLASQVDVTHPRPSAQKIFKAVDIIMQEWGME